MLTTNVGTTTTYFIGTHYEVSNGIVTKYYYAGSQRIAMRKNGTLSYLLSDHLGSTSMVTNSAGALISEMRYKAWGEVRYSSAGNPTNYTYTRQYSYTNDFGLMFYNARWYDPSLGRFAQADTIVPGGVQGLDRYAYVNNSPINYTDPSGNIPCYGVNYDDGPQCRREGSPSKWYYDNWDYQYTEEFKEAKEELKEYGYVGLSLLFEPADWAMTLDNCVHGDCSVLALGLMVIPGLSGKAGTHAETLLKEIYEKAVHNSDSSIAVLGKYIEDSSMSYEVIAEKFKATFLYTDQYEKVKKIFWQQVNEPFIYNEIIAKGKTVLLTTDLSMATGTFLDEIRILIKKGYIPINERMLIPPLK